MLKINDRKNVHNLTVNSHVQLGIMLKLKIMPDLDICMEPRLHGHMHELNIMPELKHAPS